MPTYRKKPVEIEARQLTDDADWRNIAAWSGAHPHEHTPGDLKDQLSIPTLEGVMWANVGDWIVRGVKGEFYPVKPDIFAATYEPAEPAEPAPEPTHRADLGLLDPDLIAQARTALTELLGAWQPEHEYFRDRAARKGYSHDETAAEIYGKVIGRVTEIVAMLTGELEPAAPAELTTEQQLAQQVIASATEAIDFMGIGEVIEGSDEADSARLTNEEFDELRKLVDDLIRSATVTVSWPAPEQAERKAETAGTTDGA